MVDEWLIRGDLWTGMEEEILIWKTISFTLMGGFLFYFLFRFHLRFPLLYRFFQYISESIINKKNSYVNCVTLLHDRRYISGVLLS